MRNVLLFCLFLSSCGSEREVVSQQPQTAQPVPQQPDPGLKPGGGSSFSEVAAIMKVSCARCHTKDQFISNEQAFNSSNAQTRVSNLSMPPPSSQEARGITAAERQKIVSF